MGVLSGKDLFSPKFPTAIVIDEIGTANFFQVKHPVGPYFFCDVNGELYAFDVRGMLCKWRQSLAKTFEFQIFFTDHYKPISPYLKELELITQKNDLPKLSMSLYKLFSILKLREKKPFEAIKVKKLIEDLEKDKDDDPKRFAQYKDVITYLGDLEIDEIVTPVRRVTEYLDESFMATDPKYLGSVKTAVQQAFTENREINHRPVTAKKGWAKIIAVMLLITVIGLVLYMAYEGGAFDQLSAITTPFDGVGDFMQAQNKAPPVTDVVSQYPTPESAKAAIDAGKVKIGDFPPEMRPLINSVKVEAVP
jgi:hypothetical protein